MKTILQNPQTNATVQVGMINEFRPNCYMNTTKPATKPAVVPLKPIYKPRPEEGVSTQDSYNEQVKKSKDWIWLAVAAIIGGGITYYATREKKQPKKVNV
ncbi:hypothetical protein [Capnocytophaga leadbetteri]|uniref:hypothetical protein n=1 Tax=Capnocytophaga leadbetteri TaxID=327575 RepID=UPI0026F2CD59|nr:hypothetical protein [Capnocytophaga leadbetteri]